ncbi:putative membrane protein [Rhizobium sp. BIGb0125]|nr:putative membrane protein [Rhizobium sp. BIGb0125]
MHPNSFFVNWMLGPLIILSIILIEQHEANWQRALENALSDCLVHDSNYRCASRMPQR